MIIVTIIRINVHYTQHRIKFYYLFLLSKHIINKLR